MPLHDDRLFELVQRWCALGDDLAFHREAYEVAVMNGDDQLIEQALEQEHRTECELRRVSDELIAFDPLAALALTAPKGTA